MEPVLCMTGSWLHVPHLGDFLFRVVKIFDSCSISLSGPMIGTWQALLAHCTLAFLTVFLDSFAVGGVYEASGCSL